jgi:hypothetical protein
VDRFISARLWRQQSGTGQRAEPGDGDRQHAVIWQEGSPVDLGTRGTYTFASAINNRGQAPAMNEASGTIHAFL